MICSEEEHLGACSCILKPDERLKMLQEWYELRKECLILVCCNAIAV
jgi:hypothetical protein